MRQLLFVAIMVVAFCGCQREIYVCHKVEIRKQEYNKGNADDIKMLGEVLTWIKEEWRCQNVKEGEAEFVIEPLN